MLDLQHPLVPFGHIWYISFRPFLSFRTSTVPIISSGMVLAQFTVDICSGLIFEPALDTIWDCLGWGAIIYYPKYVLIFLVMVHFPTSRETVYFNATVTRNGCASLLKTFAVIKFLVRTFLILHGGIRASTRYCREIPRQTPEAAHLQIQRIKIVVLNIQEMKCNLNHSAKFYHISQGIAAQAAVNNGKPFLRNAFILS